MSTTGITAANDEQETNQQNPKKDQEAQLPYIQDEEICDRNFLQDTVRKAIAFSTATRHPYHSPVTRKAQSQQLPGICTLLLRYRTKSEAHKCFCSGINRRVSSSQEKIGRKGTEEREGGYEPT